MSTINVLAGGFFDNPDYGCSAEASDAESALVQTYLWMTTKNVTWAERAITIMANYSTYLKWYNTSYNGPLEVRASLSITHRCASCVSRPAPRSWLRLSADVHQPWATSAGSVGIRQVGAGSGDTGFNGWVARVCASSRRPSRARHFSVMAYLLTLACSIDDQEQAMLDCGPQGRATQCVGISPSSSLPLQVARPTSTGAPWPAAQQDEFKQMLLNVTVPAIINGSCYNGNWELAMIEGLMGA